MVILINLLSIEIGNGEQEFTDGFPCFRQRNRSQRLRYILSPHHPGYYSPKYNRV